MPIHRTSLILPCRRFDDFPSHLAGERAAGLLSAWTALWHPALIAASSALPGWHSTDDMPEPAELADELVLLPSASRQRISLDWIERFREVHPDRLVEPRASRRETVSAALAAAELASAPETSDLVDEFLALGHAHLQVEQLTRAMRYTSVLDAEQFTGAVVAAAHAAVAGNEAVARDELARAFDLLSDARNHVYAVDFYIIDVTLVARSTLGDAFKCKLASGMPTSVLINGELLEHTASAHPATLAALRDALDAGTACVVGGPQTRLEPYHSPERMLKQLDDGRQTAERLLDRRFELFGQYHAAFTPILPTVLRGAGFRGALHAAFDGRRLPKADQCKTWWGASPGDSIEALAATPLDAARPETWLRLAERIGDTIAHDHVATILLAGWPGSESDYGTDLRVAAKYNHVLGKLVTLDEYFRITREPDEWSSFHPARYPASEQIGGAENPISSVVSAYRSDVTDVHRRLTAGIQAVAELADSQPAEADRSLVLNPWSFPRAQYLDLAPLEFDAVHRLVQHATALNNAGPSTAPPAEIQWLKEIPACGFAAISTAQSTSTGAIADGLTLRNEWLEVTISDTTGGIQSVRRHRDRGTRASQRLVFHNGSTASPLESRMRADEVAVTRSDSITGQITAIGNLLDPADNVLARFTQTVRLVRGLPAAIVDVLLEPRQMPENDAWTAYYASRLAWRDDALGFRRGAQWIAQPAAGPQFESPEWIEIADAAGTIVCYGLGLPLHRQAAANWLDTLLVTSGEQHTQFQFAIGIDETAPLHTALRLLSAGDAPIAGLKSSPSSPIGWFFHIDAPNVLLTHIRPLPEPRRGAQLRLLETEARHTQFSVWAFRRCQKAQSTDFRGNSTGVLSVADERVRLDIEPHRWLQIEIDW